MDWNPQTYTFCRDCPFYNSEGRYIFELEENPKLRKCKNLRACHRAAQLATGALQMKLGGC